MKAFLIRIMVFLVPVMAGACAVLFSGYDKEFGYRSMFPGCGEQGRWIYNRIFFNPKNIDVAFIGSSRTMNSVDDIYLNELARQIGDSSQYVNLAFCRTGRDLQYEIVNDLLQRKKVKLLVLEVMEKEEFFSHPDFPWLASRPNLVFPPAFNREYPRILLTGLNYRWEYAKKELLKSGIPKDGHVLSDYSYTSHDHVSDPQQLANVKKNQEENYRDTVGIFTNWYTSSWLKAIVRLAEKHEVRVAFLFLPGYGVPMKMPLENRLYSSSGPIFLIPDSVLQKPELWYDDVHFNDGGARAFSPYLHSQIESFLKTNQ